METTVIANIRKLLESRVEELKTKIQANLASTKTNASGRTSQSLHWETDEEDEGIVVTLFGRAFFQGVEFGRTGGKVPSGFRHILYQWSKDKGIQFDDEKKRRTFAYFLARKIAREGTKLYREGGRADIYTNEIKAIEKRISKDLPKVFSQDIKTIKLND